MSQSFIRTALAASLVLSTFALSPAAQAREGAQSVGKGIKCYTAAVVQADGSVKIQRVCYKSV